MSSPQSSTTPQGETSAAANSSGVDEKPRLTDAEKKHNHIESEKKRRQAIRDAFVRLTEIVPGLEGQSRSEGLVLQRTGDFLKDAIAERHRLIAEIEARGGKVEDKDRI